MMYPGAKDPLGDSTNLLQTFADSDYAADETRRSAMGSIITPLPIKIRTWVSLYISSLIENLRPLLACNPP